MTIRRAVAVALAALTVSPIIQAQTQATSISFGDRIAALRTASNIPAVGGVTFDSKSVGSIAVSGVRKLGDPAEVAPGDQWHIGSLSKSFTSTLIAKRIERGELRWDETLGELLGAARAKKFAGVTLTNVMSHRAGLPPDPSGGATGATGESITAVRRRVVDAALSGDPLYPAGTGYQYSNLDYILLGSILEEKTGKPWEDLVREEIFTPLKLTSAGFGPPGTVGAITQPRGHQANGAKLTPVEPGPFADNPPVYGPAGTIHLSIADLARWGQEHLRGERGQDGLLKAATFKILHTPPVTPGDYALGWVSQTKNGQRVIWHNGSNTLWYAIVAFNAATDKGVVLVTNGSINARAGLDALAFEIVTADLTAK